MPITMNRFKCSNGHSFEANAKLRTRCPECGVSTKRSFEKPVVEDKVNVTEKPEVTLVEKPITKSGPVLVRQGRPRMPVKKPVSTPKKPSRLIGSKVSAGLVKSHTIKKRGVTPTVTKRPIKTAIARGIKGHEQVKPYWHDVAEKYGI